MKKYTDEEMKKTFNLKHEYNDFNNDGNKFLYVAIVVSAVVLSFGYVIGELILKVL